MSLETIHESENEQEIHDFSFILVPVLKHVPCFVVARLCHGKIVDEDGCVSSDTALQVLKFLDTLE